MNKHLILCPFNCVGLGLAAMDPDWWPKRVQIFRQTCLASLANQTNKDFTVWLAFAEDTNRAQARALELLVEAEGLRVRSTFCGLPYHDDKFDGGLRNRVMNAARVVRTCWRRKSARGGLKALRRMFADVNGTLPGRVERMLCVVEGAEKVLLTRLDSDDCLREDAVAKIQSTDFDEALMMGNGYLYGVPSGKLAKLEPETCPPFFTLRMDGETFSNPLKFRAFWGDYRSHEDAPRVWGPHYLENGFYCVTTHDPKLHISGQWQHPFRGRDIIGAEREEILKRFGL